MPDNIEVGINEILYSGKLSYGDYGRKFEEKLANYIGNKNVISVSSYNHAMLILLTTLGLKYGDEVIASPVSCLASNQPFVTKGLKVVWADINPKTGSLSLESVREKITSKTKAIFHNHYCGYLGDIDELNALGKAHGIPVIDDCIEAFGSELNGNKTGNLGTDITVFSFQTVRLPNTIDGGALVFNDDELFEKAKKIRDYGIERSNFRDKLNEINPKCDITMEGYGALMSELNSYIGVHQMLEVEDLLAQQRQNAEAWKNTIKGMHNICSLETTPNTLPNNWVFGILADNKLETIKDFRAKGFYATSVHINNNIYSVFNNKEELKGVNEFMNKFVAIPCGWWITL
ncbi:aminotransferase class V-fold PLP-dependent enzyme [Owenweeksia hongkongensis]|uniref:aminotransferase class V-fold PLP-dependent enzyme n=1 Tax=Owenweeksia hongkongensis TaxID=253245 RepID=UPI003A93A901